MASQWRLENRLGPAGTIDPDMDRRTKSRGQASRVENDRIRQDPAPHRTPRRTDNRGDRDARLRRFPPMAQLDRENERRKRNADKERRRRRRGDYQQVDVTPQPTPRKQTRQPERKKRRVVSGAVMEEGRAGQSGLRGGGSWGDGDFEKEKHYRHRDKKRAIPEEEEKKKKKLCRCNLLCLIRLVLL